MKYDAIACEFYLNGAWVDLNAYRLQAAGISASMGIRSSNPIDRVASTGQLTLVLHNVNNLFTPGHVNCMEGFQSGVRFRLRLNYEGRTKTRFYGVVPPDGIEIGTTQFMSVTRVKVLDYMEQMAIHQLDLPAYTTDKRLEEVVALILANMPIQPLSTSYGTGKSTFASVFDTLRDKTRAMQEVSKAALSELGYVYVKQTADCDQVLAVEGRGGRSGAALATINVLSTTAPDTRVTEAGDTRITEGIKSGNVIVSYLYGAEEIPTSRVFEKTGEQWGRPIYESTTDTIIWESTKWTAILISAGTTYESTNDVATPDLCTTWTKVFGLTLPEFAVTAEMATQPETRILQPGFETVNAVFDNNYREIGIKHAESYYNQVDAKSYPRKIDTSDVILFSLERPLEIGASQTVTMKGRFRDPDQEAQTVAALSTVTPVSGTDYIFNAAEDESGANITSDLQVTAVYGANGVDYTLTNTGSITGYVTQLLARGKGVYIYRPVEKLEEDETLVSNDGARTLNLDLPYQDDPLQTTDIATALLAKYKQKYTAIQSVTFIANRDDTTLFVNEKDTSLTDNYKDLLLGAFIDLQIGDKIKVKAASVGIEQDCFIQSIDFTITSGDIVTYTYGVQNSMYETYDAWILEDATYGVLDSTTILGY